MIWSGVTSCGTKTPLIFIEAGVKIDQNVYLNKLASKVLPWIESQDWPHGHVFQQNGAPSPRAHRVQDWLHENFDQFWPKHFWPPSSPDMNVMDNGFLNMGNLRQYVEHVKNYRGDSGDLSPLIPEDSPFPRGLGGDRDTPFKSSGETSGMGTIHISGIFGGKSTKTPKIWGWGRD